MPGKQVLQIGLPEEQKHFVARHALFFDRLGDLKRAMELAFIRTVESSEPADRVIFYLGRLCVEDFFEILLLCGNGYGFGAIRLIRALYERATTAHYIHLHPDVALDYLEYYWVTKQKESQVLLRTFGKDALASVPKDKQAERETQYARVRQRFLVTDCKTCQTKRVNYTWSKVDLPSMAREMPALGALILPAYYLPLEHAHSTSAGILSRLGGTEEKLTFLEGPQREEADSSLHLAHNIVLQVLLLQQDHFALSAILGAPLAECYRAFVEVWGGGPDGQAKGDDLGPAAVPPSAP